MHKFDSYLQRKGHYPTFWRPEEGFRVEVAPGYIHLTRKHQEVYIPRSLLIPLLKWLIPLAKMMEGDFDPEQAIHDYLEQEEAYDQARRLEKKTRSRVPRHLR